MGSEKSPSHRSYVERLWSSLEGNHCEISVFLSQSLSPKPSSGGGGGGGQRVLV